MRVLCDMKLNSRKRKKQAIVQVFVVVVVVFSFPKLGNKYRDLFSVRRCYLTHAYIVFMCCFTCVVWNIVYDERCVVVQKLHL